MIKFYFDKIESICRQYLKCSLTLFHKISTFNDSERFVKYCGKKEKILVSMESKEKFLYLNLIDFFFFLLLLVWIRLKFCSVKVEMMISVFYRMNDIYLLTHYHTIPHFDALKIYSCGKHCKKRSNACNKQFLLFSQCFLPYMVLIYNFKCTLKCCLQFVSIWNSLNFCHLVMG